MSWPRRHARCRAVALVLASAVVLREVSFLFCTGADPQAALRSLHAVKGGRVVACRDRANFVSRAARGGDVDFQVGDAVEAVFPEDGEWYTGVVEKDNADGSFDVKWDDPDGGPSVSPCKAEDIKKYVPPIPLNEVVVGQKYKGIVQGTASFGAFVDIGAEVNGLVHISAMKDGFVENVDDEVEYGQEIDVWVKDIRDGKVSLVMVESKLQAGAARARAEPADLSAFADIPWGERLTGTVASVRDFGCFVRVTAPSGGEAQGLVHISEMSDGFVEDPHSEVRIGDEVSVYVKDVDAGGGRLSLSMKSTE